MSAVEIIEQIKALPEDERETVYQFVEKARSNLASAGSSAAGASECIPVEELKNSAQEMFKRYRPMFEKLAE